MRKTFVILILSIFFLSLSACSVSYTETDYASSMMVEGKIYYITVTDVSAEINKQDILGYISSYTDTFPMTDGQTNFSKVLHMPYASANDGLAVFYDDTWFLCTP